MAALLTLRSFQIGSDSSPHDSNWQGQPAEVRGEPRDYSGESRGILEPRDLLEDA
jgi:hypothetical protein